MQARFLSNSEIQRILDQRPLRMQQPEERPLAILGILDFSFDVWLIVNRSTYEAVGDRVKDMIEGSLNGQS